MTVQNSGVKPRPTRVALAAFAAPCLAVSALYLPLNVYVPEFYANVVGLKLAIVGLVFMTVRLADIAFDPFIGGIMDRTRTRWGQFKPWLALSAPLIMLGVGKLFMAHRGVGPFYLAIWLAVVYAGFSIGTLAQLAIGAGLSDQYQERSRVFSWWQGANAIAITIAILIPIVWNKVNPGGELVPAMAWWILAVTPPAIAWALFGVKEPPAKVQRSRNGAMAYFLLLRRGSMRMILLTDLMMGIGAGVSAAVGIFFITAIKHLDKSALGLMLIFYLLTGILATPLWTMAAKRLQKHRAWALAALISACSMVIELAAPVGNLTYLCVAHAFGGLAFGGNYMLPRAMMADAGDEERLETGEDRTGLLYAWVTSVYKIGQAASIGIVFVALEFVHFNPAKGAVNLPSATAILPLLFGVIPAALCVTAAVTLWSFPLTAARHAQIRALLAGTASGPVSEEGGQLHSAVSGGVSAPLVEPSLD